MPDTIKHYLQQENSLLNHLLPGLNQFQTWNTQLKECLQQDTALTEHCFIVNKIGTSLIVLADNSHWLTRFRFHIPELLIKLQRYPGLETIQSICCKVKPHYEPVSQVNYREPQQKLSSENAILVQETAKSITDEKLRAVLEKIACRVK